ncbi:unnamed protein product [Ceutorhynchus assimilis]|uniref:CID domain-containing protein n=1 Tax=Ceutorhynchus assimilis TaxID=467358 RepID=A0A9N9QH88_9CUCU|nr:unnamed protein product [Ceutorhynchus assimilis]
MIERALLSLDQSSNSPNNKTLILFIDKYKGTMSDEFTESAFADKLLRLDNSSKSIQSLSEWVITHQEHYTSVVKVWVREIIKAQEHRRITLLFFANDVIQSSRKTGRKYCYEFGRDLETVFKHMSNSDEKTKNEVGRLLSIWREREIYGELQISLFQRALVMGFKDPLTFLKARAARTTSQSKLEERIPVEVDESLETQVRPHNVSECSKMIQALKDFEANKKSDSVGCATKIAILNRKIPDAATINGIRDRDKAEILVKEIHDVATKLRQYETSSDFDTRQRIKLVNIVNEFLQVQKDLISQGENAKQQYAEKLSEVTRVEQKLEAHMQSLPKIIHTPDDGMESFMQ